MSVLQRSLPLNDQKIILKEFETNWEDMEKGMQDDIQLYDLSVSRSDFKVCDDVLPVIVYLAGYCSYAVVKKMKCNHCKDLVTCADGEIPDSHNYIDAVSRGSLMHPDAITTNVVMYNYIIINKLTRHPHFLQTVNQRKVANKITLNALADDDGYFPVDSCDAGHSAERIVHMIVWASTNALINNYCSKENNNLIANKVNSGKKRKLETLTQATKKQSTGSVTNTVCSRNIIL